MENSITHEYLAALKEEAQMYSEAVITGKCKDFETYKYKIGYIEGLIRAETLLHDTIKAAFENSPQNDGDD